MTVFSEKLQKISHLVIWIHFGENLTFDQKELLIVYISILDIFYDNQNTFLSESTHFFGGEGDLDLSFCLSM